MWVTFKTRKSTMSTAQQRYLQKKFKDPEYRQKVNTFQRERYRRLIADPVTRKQIAERKKIYDKKYKEKKRLQKLERQQVVKNGPMTDKDDGMVLDIREKYAVQCPSGTSERNMQQVTADGSTSTQGEMIHDSSTQKESVDVTDLMSDIMKPLMKRMMEDLMSDLMKPLMKRMMEDIMLDINQCLTKRVMQYFNPNSGY